MPIASGGAQAINDPSPSHSVLGCSGHSGPVCPLLFPCVVEMGSVSNLARTKRKKQSFFQRCYYLCMFWTVFCFYAFARPLPSLSLSLNANPPPLSLSLSLSLCFFPPRSHLVSSDPTPHLQVAGVMFLLAVYSTDHLLSRLHRRRSRRKKEGTEAIPNATQAVR